MYKPTVNTLNKTKTQTQSHITENLTIFIFRSMSCIDLCIKFEARLILYKKIVCIYIIHWCIHHFNIMYNINT